MKEKKRRKGKNERRIGKTKGSVMGNQNVIVSLKMNGEGCV